MAIFLQDVFVLLRFNLQIYERHLLLGTQVNLFPVFAAVHHFPATSGLSLPLYIQRVPVIREVVNKV